MQAYAYKNTEAAVRASSSGGAFPAVVDALYEASETPPLVVGAAWGDGMTLRHRMAASREEANAFRGSKYVQSNLEGIFPAVCDQLRAGRNVLFSGTPCQVDALLSYARRKQVSAHNLYTADIICHGVSSPALWLDFIRWLETRHRQRLVAFTFRDKRRGWKHYPTLARFDNGEEAANTYEVRTWMRLYFSHLMAPKCCFSCRYAGMDRPSDLTLGDFWGVEQEMPTIDAENGVSLVLVGTKKGEALMERIRARVDRSGGKETLARCETDGYIRHQRNLQMPIAKPEQYDAFWRHYRAHGFAYVLKKYNFFTWHNRIRFVLGNVKRRGFFAAGGGTNA